MGQILYMQLTSGQKRRQTVFAFLIFQYQLLTKRYFTEKSYHRLPLEVFNC